MLQVFNNTIQLSVGDSAVLDVDLINPDTKKEYILASGDKIYFTVKSSLKDLDNTLQIEGLPFTFTPGLTSLLNPGQYYYDIKLIQSDGTIMTVCPPRPFILLDVVSKSINKGE